MRFAIACLLLIAAVPASAGTITYEFTGHISNILGPTDALGGVKDGDLFTARWVFDTSAPNESQEVDLGVYRTTTCFFQLPNLSATGSEGTMLVSPLFGSEGQIAMEGVGPTWTIDLVMYPPTPGILTETTLPLLISDTWTGFMGISASSGGNAYAGIETISVTPEPAAILLFGAGPLLLRRSRPAA